MDKEYRQIEREDEIKEAFNNMPFEHRVISSDSEIVTRIRDLERQKSRLKQNYEREIAFINKKIKNHEQSLKQKSHG